VHRASSTFTMFVTNTERANLNLSDRAKNLGRTILKKQVAGQISNLCVNA
jgi:hypothetical protein